MRDTTRSTPTVTASRSTVSAAPSNTEPRSVSAKMPTGSVTQSGG
jgi:hypothetical protein